MSSSSRDRHDKQSRQRLGLSTGHPKSLELTTSLWTEPQIQLAGTAGCCPPPCQDLILVPHPLHLHPRCLVAMVCLVWLHHEPDQTENEAIDKSTRTR